MSRLRMVTYTIDVEGDDVLVSGEGEVLHAEGLEASFSLEPEPGLGGVHLSVYSDIAVNDDAVEVATTFYLDKEAVKLIKEFLVEGVSVENGPKLA